MSEVKPFRWSFVLSLPLIVAATSTAFVLLTRVERGQMVTRLSDCAAHASADEAVVAVRQLAGLPRPPIEPLVAAAAAPSRPVAIEAQLAISELLRQWQRQLNSGKKVGRIVVQLQHLAEALDRHVDGFSPRDYPWLTKTTEKIVQLANRAPQDTNAELAVHCDSLLNAVNRHSRTSAAVKPAASSTNDVTPVGPSPNAHESDGIYTSPSASAFESLLPTEAAKAAQPKPNLFAWTPRWLPPSHTTAVATPLRAELRVPLAVRAVPSPPTTAANRLAAVESRELLKLWLDDDGVATREVERELERRGFGPLSFEMIRPLLHEDAADRARLVYDLMGLPGVNAKAWLTLLAEDANADVRFAAVTVMATSNDAVLLDKAWDIVLHDRDPRIASLAEQLRTRRVGAQRR